MPLMNDTKYAAMGAALMFTTQLTPAIAGTTKAFTAMIDSQVQLAAAQNLGNISRGKAIMNILKQNKAMIGLGVAMAAGMYLHGRVNEQRKEALQLMQKETALIKQAIGDLVQVTDKTVIFGDGGDYLREKFDLVGVTLKDLANDADLTAETLDMLTDHNYQLSAAQDDQVRSAIEQLRIMKQIQTGTTEFSDELEKAIDKAEDTYDGVGEFFNFLDEATAWSDERQDAAFDLKDALGLSDDAIDDGWIDDLDLDVEQVIEEVLDIMKKGQRLTEEEMDMLSKVIDIDDMTKALEELNDVIINEGTAEEIEMSLFGDRGAENAMENIDLIGKSVENLTEDIFKFGGAREELFFGGKYGNVTGSLYKQVITQGVGTLYNKMDIVMSNNFHGFFNEEAAAHKIINVLERYAANGGEVALD